MQHETIEGVVEDIIYYSADSGYTVLSLRPDKIHHRQDDEEIVVVGKLMELQPGEKVRFTGTWTIHKEYGQQFKASAMHVINPMGSDVLRYLLTSNIHGLGEKTAQQIVSHFGDRAIDILDDDPSKIEQIPGINKSRAKLISASWAEQRRERKVMMFLQEYGITAGLAHRIFDSYGDDTIQIVEKNPYQLAIDIEEIDFKLADDIAKSVGLKSNSPARVQAGIIFALKQLSTEGHIYGPRPLVAETAAELLGVPIELCENAITHLAKNGDVQSVKRKDGPSGNLEVIYLPHMYDNEYSAAQKLLAMVEKKESALKKVKNFDWKAFFAKLDGVELTDQQRDAVQSALTNKISVLTGGPGTGKTTTLRAVIKVLDAVKAEYVLASPTGRAARRLSEATGRPARTLHRVLGYQLEGGFTYDETNPLDCDFIIVDEASMLDLELFARLLDAMTEKMHLMLVGDVDQLPSVGAGNVLHDVINSGIAHVTRLDVIFRQASDSYVIVNAHRINKGEMPDVGTNSTDFFLFNVADTETEDVLDLILDVVSNRIPSKFGLNPLDDVQVLAPMYKGDLGINALNDQLQRALNSNRNAFEHTILGRKFRVGDKVIQTRNNYEKEVYNGDIGRIVLIDPEEQTLEINMDGRNVEYKWKETAELFHAYAISIHRSQGSEYPAVVIPMMPQYSRMLQRNLLYTAITRARQLVVLVGTKRAIQMAVENNKVAHRYSGLAWRLKNPVTMP